MPRFQVGPCTLWMPGLCVGGRGSCSNKYSYMGASYKIEEKGAWVWLHGAWLVRTKMTLLLRRPQRPEYKIILLGELGVGKTTFFKRVRDGSEHGAEYTCSTVTADSLTHTMRIGDAEVKVTAIMRCNVSMIFVPSLPEINTVDASRGCMG